MNLRRPAQGDELLVGARSRAEPLLIGGGIHHLLNYGLCMKSLLMSKWNVLPGVERRPRASGLDIERGVPCGLIDYRRIVPYLLLIRKGLGLTQSGCCIGARPSTTSVVIGGRLLL